MHSNLVSSFMTDRRFLALGLIAIGCLVLCGPSAAQNANAPEAPATEVAFEITSMTVDRFNPPIVLGAGKQAVRYRSALVVVAEVDQTALDALSPSLAPYLAIGRELLGIHLQETPKEGSDRTRLVFHAPNWQQLEPGAPIYLTTDVESILQNRRKPKRDTPRFDPESITR